MFRLKHKWRIPISEISKQYYERLFPTAFDEEPNEQALQFFSDLKSICATEMDSKEIAFHDYATEIIALNIELFGIAWLSLNQNPREDIRNSDSYLTEEIIATKEYLQTKGWSIVWEKMNYYTSFLCESRLYHIKFVSSMKERYTQDSDCLLRLFHRTLIYSEFQEHSGIAGKSQKLSLTLEKRLGCTLSREGFLFLENIVVGLWVDIMNYLEAVNEYGSISAAEQNTIDMIGKLKKIANS
jgi:hypothetical protein